MNEKLAREIINTIGTEVGNKDVFYFDEDTLLYVEIKNTSYDKYLYLEMIEKEHGEMVKNWDCSIEVDDLSYELFRMVHY